MKKIVAIIMCAVLLCSHITAFASSATAQTDKGGEQSMSDGWSIRTSDIHPELRLVGNLIRTVMPHFTVRFFKLANFFVDGIGIPNLTRGINYEEKYITGEDGNEVRICVYSPKEKKENAPGLLWIHGGGYGLGRPEQDFSFIQSFVDASGCVIVAPDYTNSMTAPYPAALNDCYAALLWLRENGADYGMPGKLYTGGKPGKRCGLFPLSAYCQSRSWLCGQPSGDR